IESTYFYGGAYMSGLLKGKNIVVMGVANQRSMVWGIAKSVHREDANLIITNRQERSKKKLEKLLEENNIQPALLVTCDVASDESIGQAFDEIGEKLGVIHGVIHSVAFANTEE